MYHRSGSVRREQAHAVKEEVDASPYPVILAGDFNVPPLSRTYYILKRGLRDCFLETIFLRYGTTYPLRAAADAEDASFSPGVRIDYIFCSPSLTPLTSEVISTAASDHYPLRCTIGY
ncbi:MAG: endonuclease/exonuclease/phosphatase family protein [Paludibacteraceae bacterium]|nr:endonuclease/exonuclease/phosphatase family protein [Paludibacteraceae bacterium]